MSMEWAQLLEPLHNLGPTFFCKCTSIVGKGLNMRYLYTSSLFLHLSLEQYYTDIPSLSSCLSLAREELRLVRSSLFHWSRARISLSFEEEDHSLWNEEKSFLSLSTLCNLLCDILFFVLTASARGMGSSLALCMYAFTSICNFVLAQWLVVWISRQTTSLLIANVTYDDLAIVILVCTSILNI